MSANLTCEAPHGKEIQVHTLMTFLSSADVRGSLFCSEKVKRLNEKAKKKQESEHEEKHRKISFKFSYSFPPQNKHGRRLKLIFLYSHCELALKLLAVSESDRCWARESHSSRNTQRKRIEVHWVFSVLLYDDIYILWLRLRVTHSPNVVCSLCESYWKISNFTLDCSELLVCHASPFFPLFTCIAFSHTRLRWQVEWEETMSTVDSLKITSNTLCCAPARI